MDKSNIEITIEISKKIIFLRDNLKELEESLRDGKKLYEEKKECTPKALLEIMEMIFARMEEDIKNSHEEIKQLKKQLRKL